MAAIKARLPPVPPRRSACGSRSSSVSPAAMALPSCPSAGWSSALSPGSAVIAAWPRTSRQPSPRPQPWFTSPRSSSSCGVSQNLDQQSFVLEWALSAKRCLRIVDRYKGNHRTGALIMSYILARDGKPPFVLSVENAIGYFDPSSVIKGTRKTTFALLFEIPRIKKRFAEFLHGQADRKYLADA